jgi:hypothetical protein
MVQVDSACRNIRRIALYLLGCDMRCIDSSMPHWYHCALVRVSFVSGTLELNLHERDTKLVRQMPKVDECSNKERHKQRRATVVKFVPRFCRYTKRVATREAPLSSPLPNKKVVAAPHAAVRDAIQSDHFSSTLLQLLPADMQLNANSLQPSSGSWESSGTRTLHALF